MATVQAFLISFPMFCSKGGVGKIEEKPGKFQVNKYTKMLRGSRETPHFSTTVTTHRLAISKSLGGWGHEKCCQLWHDITSRENPDVT